MKKNINVLITGAGTVTCQSIIKGLKFQQEFNVKIVTVDMDENNAGKYFSDIFFKIPAAKDENFIPILIDICVKEKIDVLIPIIDYEFDKLSKTTDLFASIGCKVIISNPNAIKLCNDKWETFKFISSLELSTPESFIAENFDSNRCDFPLFIKPRCMGRASIDAYRVDNREQLDHYMKLIDDPIIQDCIDGDEFTIDILCDFNGIAINALVRKRIETKVGVSYKGKTIKDGNIIKGAIKIAESLPIVGHANIQCFKNKDGIHYFEINPRYSGTLVLSIAAGFNSPHILMKLALDISVEYSVGSYEEDVTMYRYWQEVYTDKNGNVLPKLEM